MKSRQEKEFSMKSYIGIFTFLFFTSCQLFKDSNMDIIKMNEFISVLKDKKIVSGSALLLDKGKIIYLNNYNFNQEISDPIYHIGSISKIYTASIILKLVEEGKISLADKLSLYFPEVDQSELITIDHLLRHRSGIPNMTDLADYEKYSHLPQSEVETLNRFKKYKLEFAPGVKYEYSNTGYVLLTYIAQKASGENYQTLLEKYITKPLQLKNTFVFQSTSRRSSEVKSYLKKSNWVDAPNTHESVALGAGAIASTPVEVATFIRSLFKDKILSKNTFKVMLEFEGDGEYGQGIMKFPYNNEIFYGHTGGIDGFLSIVGYNKKDDLVMVNLTNATVFNFNDISIALLASFYGDDFSLPVIEEVVQVSTAILDQYNGIYGSSDFPITLTFKNENGVLIGLASGSAQSEIPFEAASQTKFKFPRAKISLEFKDAGDTLVFTQGESIVLKKIK